MCKLYNTFESISSDLANYLKESSNNISKPQAYNLSYIVIGAIQANSIIASKVALNFKGILSNNNQILMKNALNVFSTIVILIFTIFMLILYLILFLRTKLNTVIITFLLV